MGEGQEEGSSCSKRAVFSPPLADAIGLSVFYCTRESALFVQALVRQICEHGVPLCLAADADQCRLRGIGVTDMRNQL